MCDPVTHGPRCAPRFVSDVWFVVATFADIDTLLACLCVSKAGRAAAVGQLVGAQLDACRARIDFAMHYAHGAAFPAWLVGAGVVRAVFANRQIELEDHVERCNDFATLEAFIDALDNKWILTIKYARLLSCGPPDAPMCQLVRQHIEAHDAHAIDHIWADRTEPLDLEPNHVHAKWMVILDRPRHANVGTDEEFAIQLACAAKYEGAQRCIAALFENALDVAWEYIAECALDFTSEQLARYLGPTSADGLLVWALIHCTREGPVCSHALALLLGRPLDDLVAFDVVRVLLRRAPVQYTDVVGALLEEHPIVELLACELDPYYVAEMEFLLYVHPVLSVFVQNIEYVWFHVEHSPRDQHMLNATQLAELSDVRPSASIQSMGNLMSSCARYYVE